MATALENPPGALLPRERPSKPRPDFPLFPHRSGQWCKKVRGRFRYFGPWRDPEAALRIWLAQKDDLLAGRAPRPVGADDVTVRELVNDFLTTKKLLVDSGEMTERTWLAYLAAGRRLCDSVGKNAAIVALVPSDFEKLRTTLGKTWGPVHLGNEIQRVRSIFRHAVSQGFLDRPVLFGSGFAKPSRKVLRKARAAKGPRMFSAEQLRDLLQATGPTLRAMLLLGINCGLGNHDVAALQRKHLDLKAGWIDYPRPKTGVPRRAKLWPETVAAIRRVVRLRRKRKVSRKGAEAQRSEVSGTNPQSLIPNPRPSGKRKLLFLNRRGRSWLPRLNGNPISSAMLRLLRRRKCWRPGLGFYALRHTFETVGGASKDQIAVDFIMGHAPDSRDMSAVYREHLDDERLTAVAELVRKWLWPEGEEGQGVRG